MTAYDVDLAELRSTVRLLAACQRDLLSLAGEIDEAQGRLQDGWAGRARNAEETSYAAWRAGCADMVTALASLRRIAEAADEQYAAAVGANVALWTAVGR
jgi:WXG100 family type VII secretion target